MSNISSLSYRTIPNPYNNMLERATEGVDASVGGEIGGGGVGRGDGDGGGGNGENGEGISSPNAIAPNAIEGSALKDLWIESFIKSRGYKPKSQGFLIDGRKGYIECNKLYVGSGGIEGGSIHIANETDANSFHTSALGNSWWGANVATGYAGANAYVLNTGRAKFKDVTLDSNVIVADLKPGSALAIQYLTAGIITSKAITLAVSAGTGDTKIQTGKTAFTNTDTGFILGIDDVHATLGDATSQWDVSFVAGTTWRYTWDGAGTDPDVDGNVIVGDTVVISGFAAVNNGTFTVTGVSTNYFDVTNASGTAEVNITSVTINVGGRAKFYIGNPSYHFNWTGTGIDLKAKHSNLELYDYVVDATGYGDYTTVKAAIDAATAASATEVTVFVRKGTYTQTGNIAFTGNVTIVGENKDETVVNCTSATVAEWLDVTGILEISNIKVTKNSDGEYIIKATGNGSIAQNCIFENSNNNGTGTADGKCINFTGDYSKVIDCYITKAFKGITFAAVVNGLIQGNYIETQTGGVDSRGIDIIIGSDDTIVNNNTVVLKLAGVSKGIYAVSNRLIISQNNISNSAGTNGTGIYLIAPDAGTTSFLIISDNTINAVADGIYVDSSYSHISIKNNHIKTTNGGAIKVAAAASYFEVCDNVIDTGARGIWFASSLNYSHIDRNTLTGFGTGVQNIIVAGNCTFSSINNNIIQNGGSGIYLTGNNDDSIINNNVLNNITGSGIVLNTRCLRCGINNNILKSCSSIGIQSNGLSQQSVISGNLINSAGDSGIKFNNTVFDCIISNNESNSCGNDGIDFGAQNCAGTQVIGNHCESNTDDGIVANYATHNFYMVINSNCCLGNGDTGIKVDTRSSTIIGNVVVSNTTAQITDVDGTGSVNTNNVVA